MRSLPNWSTSLPSGGGPFEATPKLAEGLVPVRRLVDRSDMEKSNNRL